MSIRDLVGFGFGLVALGLCFVLMDYLLIRLMVRAGASEPETWKLAADLPPDASGEVVRSYKICRVVMTHRFRRGGIITVLVGLAVLICSGLWWVFK